MDYSRIIYTTCYILFLIGISAVLAIVLPNSGSPFWVWYLYGIGILIAVIGAIVKQVKLRFTVVCGKIVQVNKGWSTAYVLLHILYYIY